MEGDGAPAQEEGSTIASTGTGTYTQSGSGPASVVLVKFRNTITLHF